MRRLTLLPRFVALWLMQAPAALAAADAAEPGAATRADASESESARVVLAFSPTLAAAEKCTRDSDVVGCTLWQGFLGVAASALFPLLPELSLGPFVNAGFDGRTRGSSSRFGAAGAELRVLPYTPSSFWLSARAGVYTVHDVTRVETGSDAGEHVSQAWAPSLGGGLGFDVELAACFGLSFAWSFDYVMLSSEGALPEDHGVDWSAGLWLAFGLGVYWNI